MPSTCTLTGGAWQDTHGNVVANGTLVLTLCQDAVVSGTNQVAPTTVTFPLDSSGNLQSGATVYANSALSPAGTFYTVEVLNSGGSRVWGPEKWSLSVGTTNANTIVPALANAQIVSPLTIETNRTNNASQVLLNFQDTSSITWTNPSGGNVQATVVGGAANTFTAAPAWWSNGDGSPYEFSPNSGAVGAAADLILFHMFRLDYAFKFFRCSFRQAGNGGAGCTSGFGIYSNDGTTKLASWDAIPTTGTGDRDATLGAAVTLQPGVYIFAFGRSGGVSAPNTDSGYGTSASSDNSESWNKGGIVRSGQAANSLSAGVMPSSLGVLSTSTNWPATICCVTFGPT